MSFLAFNNKLKIRLGQEFMFRGIAAVFYIFAALFFANHFGVKAAGLLLVVYFFIGFVFNILSGYYSDRIGRKKILMIAEILRTFAIAALAIFNSPNLSLPIISGFMFMVLRSSFGLYQPAAEGMMIDLSSPEERKAVYTWIYWVYNVWLSVAGIIGGFLYKHHFFDMLLVLGAFSIVSNLLVLFFLPETLEKKQETNRENVFTGLFKSYKEVVGDKLLVGITIGFMLIGAMEGQLTNYFAVRMSGISGFTFLSHHFTGIHTYGFLMAENAILVVLLTLILGKLTAKWSEGKTLIITMFSYVIGFSLLCYVSNAGLLFLLIAIGVASEVIMGPMIQSFFSYLPSEEKRSSYISFFQLSMYGSLLCGAFYVTLSGFFNALTMFIIFS